MSEGQHGTHVLKEVSKVVATPLPDAARAKRRTIVLGFLAVVGVFVVLTFRYSGQRVGSVPQAPTQVALPPLGVDQIEAISKRLEGRPAPFSKDGAYLSPEERGEEQELGGEEDGRHEVGWDEPTPPRPRAAPGTLAIDSPLVPADSGANSGAAALPGRSAGTEAGRGAGGLGELERLTAQVRDSLPEFPAPPALPAAPSSLPSTQLPSSSVVRRTALSNRLLAAGSAIPLVLAHRVVTDVPGPVVGLAVRDIYDTLTSSRLLIPRGARCFGEIAGQPGFGDNRVTIAWSNCQANGVRLDFEPQGSASLDGSSGIPAAVNHHWGQRLGTALALSFISAGVQAAQPERRDSTLGFTPGQILAGQVGTDLGRVSTEILERGFARPPTLTLEAGTAVQLLVLKDLEIP